MQTAENIELAVEDTKHNQEVAERAEEVVKFFDWLEHRERDILEMVLLQGMTPVAAGEQLGLGEWAAYKAYERALQHLRDLIAEHGGINAGGGH